MTGPRQTRDETMMQVALAYAARSTCSRLQVGAVISWQGRTISSGYNGAPAGLPHCACGPDVPCDDTVHAEANAIAFAARYGAATERADMHTTHQPCLGCAKLIVNAGICRVVFWLPYRLRDGLDLLEAAGVDTMRMTR